MILALTQRAPVKHIHLGRRIRLQILRIHHSDDLDTGIATTNYDGTDV